MRKFLRVLIPLILLILITADSSISANKYMLGIPIAASNGLPIKNGTFAIYDSSGVTSVASLTYLKSFFYYYTTSITPGWYDIKQRVGSTWHTYLDNVWLINTYTFINDSVMYYVNVDDTTIQKTDDTLAVRASGIDSSHVRDGSLSPSDLLASTTPYTVLRTSASAVGWGKIDSAYVTNGSLQLVDLENYTLNLDGSGLTALSGVTFGVSYTALNVNVDSSTIHILDDTLSVMASSTPNEVFVTTAVGLDWIKIDSSYITNGGIHNNDLAGSIANAKLANSTINVTPTAPIEVNGYTNQSASIALGQTLTLSMQLIDSVTLKTGAADTLVFHVGDLTFSIIGD